MICNCDGMLTSRILLHFCALKHIATLKTFRLLGKIATGAKMMRDLQGSGVAIIYQCGEPIQPALWQ